MESRDFWDHYKFMESDVEERALVVGRKNLEKYLEELKARHCEVSIKQPLEEDTFGMSDRDFKEEVEEDVDEDEAKLSRLTSRLKCSSCGGDWWICGLEKERVTPRRVESNAAVSNLDFRINTTQRIGLGLVLERSTRHIVTFITFVSVIFNCTYNSNSLLEKVVIATNKYFKPPGLLSRFDRLALKQSGIDNEIYVNISYSSNLGKMSMTHVLELPLHSDLPCLTSIINRVLTTEVLLINLVAKTYEELIELLKDLLVVGRMKRETPWKMIIPRSLPIIYSPLLCG
ncbi:hypothetical protein SELMODRAFT_431555 [Selaginella moellendorffii]|uniref:Uncharacterized protein n=1 Tax=Selaginella moellendorffii TaxID=88036 RepID=D8TD16_SELML|nr:hypothetical protein SELMODRAFT_431555 [Selaginella moellendorffii]